MFLIEQIINSGEKMVRSSNTEKSQKVNPIKFNPFLHEFNVDPYPMYRRLQAENPICRSIVRGDWVLTRYDDVKTVLRDRRVSVLDRSQSIQAKNKYIQKQGKNFYALADASSKLLMYINPPDHTRLRALINKDFFGGVIKSMRPQIQEIVDECLDTALYKGDIEIIGDLAEPLPVKVIATMLGVPSNDAQDSLHQWSRILSRVIEPLISLEDYEAMNKATLEFYEYFRYLISQREKAPQDDLISHLITAKNEGKKLSIEEVLSTCMLLFVAAEETTVNTIGNGILALLHHPDQMDKLKEEPRFIQTAVEEILRYDSPAQMTFRIATENLKIGNQVIRKGERIILYLGAANRDSAKFPAADQFDILRQENDHLAFGDGIHHCLGAALGRIQAEIAINTLVQKLPDMKLGVDKLEWRKSFTLRGLKALPVNFRT
jgi:pimeloyl-[acyl-carrier protein] synthase